MGSARATPSHTPFILMMIKTTRHPTPPHSHSHSTPTVLRSYSLVFGLVWAGTYNPPHPAPTPHPLCQEVEPGQAAKPQLADRCDGGVAAAARRLRGKGRFVVEVKFDGERMQVRARVCACSRVQVCVCACVCV